MGIRRTQKPMKELSRTEDTRSPGGPGILRPDRILPDFAEAGWDNMLNNRKKTEVKQEF